MCGFIENGDVDSVRRVFIEPYIQMILQLVEGLPRVYRKKLSIRIATRASATVALAINSINVLSILRGTKRRADTHLLIR